ncbi:MAG: PepSY domain-containing protein [Actinomycetaceae bacterium]|nr:PepSY domain-containing protein [Actinomycetaceae bacterium]
MKKMRILATISTATLALTLSGCGDSPHDSENSPAPETTQSQSTDTSDSSHSQEDTNRDGPFADTANAINAVKAAEAQNGGKLIELDREDSDQVWEIEVIEGEEEVTYYVSADGSVTEHKRKDADQDDLAKVADAISATEAIQKAFDELGGGYLDECELDENNGIIVYEMDFDDENGNDFAEIEIDSRSGDIAKKEMDN